MGAQATGRAGSDRSLIVVGILALLHTCTLASLSLLWQELWHHGQSKNWDIRSVWSHVYSLFDGPVSTKECLEDVFSELSHMSKSLHKDAGRASPERLFTHSLLANRLDEEAWPRAALEKSDMTTKSFQKYKKTRQVFIPRKTSQTEAGQKMLELAGLEACYSVLMFACFFVLELRLLPARRESQIVESRRTAGGLSFRRCHDHAAKPASAGWRLRGSRRLMAGGLGAGGANCAPEEEWHLPPFAGVPLQCHLLVGGLHEQ